jgi:hypothetical protein
MKSEKYKNKYDLMFPNTSYVKGELKTKVEWLAIMPKNVHSKFDEWFIKN